MMNKRLFAVLSFLAVFLFMTGCAGKGSTGKNTVLQDGVYEIGVKLSGGSGKASVASPAKLVMNGGEMAATLV